MVADAGFEGEMKEKGTRETENSSTGRNKRAGLSPST
jgi:hypothetical protein